MFAFSTFILGVVWWSAFTISVSDVGWVFLLCVSPGGLVVIGFFYPNVRYLGYYAVGPGWVLELDVALEVLCSCLVSFLTLECECLCVEVTYLLDEFFFCSVRVVYGKHY